MVWTLGQSYYGIGVVIMQLLVKSGTILLLQLWCVVVLSIVKAVGHELCLVVLVSGFKVSLILRVGPIG